MAGREIGQEHLLGKEAILMSLSACWTMPDHDLADIFLRIQRRSGLAAPVFAECPAFGAVV